MTLEISRPWARAALTLTATGGGFFVLANTGAVPDRLVSASTPAAGKVAIHAIKVVGSKIRMQPVENGLAILAGATLTLKPRGYHLLLTGLKTPLVPGSKVPVTLVFEASGAIEAELTVEAPGLVGEETLVETSQSG